MRVTAAIVLGVAAVVLVAWGIGLIVKSVTGGTPDSSTGAIVAIGVVIILCGSALGVAARTSWRR